jgi:hypothetical protein
MIGFFRKIRKKLAENNKPMKYMRYAVGEILLVMIGILLALQVNNWNEERKERQLEFKVLTEIKNNLNFDLVDFESNISHLKNIKTSCQSILNTVNDDLVYNDSLGYYFFYLKIFPHFTPKINGYSSLQAKGIEIIQNDSLKFKITNLYEDRYKYILTWERERINYKDAILEKMMIPYSGTRSLSKEIVPKSFILKGSIKSVVELGTFREIKNFEILKEDTEFHGVVKEVEIATSILILIHENVQDNVSELANLIEKELEHF